jgi:hypothetical protein
MVWITTGSLHVKSTCARGRSLGLGLGLGLAPGLGVGLAVGFAVGDGDGSDAVGEAAAVGNATVPWGFGAVQPVISTAMISVIAAFISC